MEDLPFNQHTMIIPHAIVQPESRSLDYLALRVPAVSDEVQILIWVALHRPTLTGRCKAAILSGLWHDAVISGVTTRSGLAWGWERQCLYQIRAFAAVGCGKG